MVLLVIHIIIVVCLIGVILLQRSSNDGFTGGGVGGMNSLMSGRASANLLTRTTAILATAFIISSLVLAYIASHTEHNASLVGDSAPATDLPDAIPASPASPAVEAEEATEGATAPAVAPESTEVEEDTANPAADAPAVPMAE